MTRARRSLLFGLGAAALILAASVADSWAFAHLTLPRVNDQDWGRLLRTMGFLPLWLLAGLALYRSTTTPSGRRHAVLLMAAPTLSGALGEGLNPGRIGRSSTSMGIDTDPSRNKPARVFTKEPRVSGCCDAS